MIGAPHLTVSGKGGSAIGLAAGWGVIVGRIETIGEQMRGTRAVGGRRASRCASTSEAKRRTGEGPHLIIDIRHSVGARFRPRRGSRRRRKFPPGDGSSCMAAGLRACADATQRPARGRRTRASHGHGLGGGRSGWLRELVGGEIATVDEQPDSESRDPGHGRGRYGGV